MFETDLLTDDEVRIRNLEVAFRRLARRLDALEVLARAALEAAGRGGQGGQVGAGVIWAKVTTAIAAPTLSTSAIPSPGAAQIRVRNPITNQFVDSGDPVPVYNGWPGTAAAPVGKVVQLDYDPQQNIFWLKIENCTNPG